MLEAIAGPAGKTRQTLAWGVGAFALGALACVLGMLQKPAPLEFRFLEALLVGAGVLLASGGLLGVVAAFPVGAGEAEPSHHVSVRALWPGFLQVAGFGLALRFVVNRAITGSVPAPTLTLAVAVPALTLGALAGVMRCAHVLAPPQTGDGTPPGFWRRWGGSWVTVLTVLLYLPGLGSFAMIDCWEPQYSEVAREMLARHDWISLWWGDQAWFWSKPILDFWLQGVSFAWFGLDPAPEMMLQGIAAGRTPLPEWAARLPIFAIALAAQLLLERGVASHFGQRAARLGSLVLVTCPYWFFLARQTMVDMPYAAPFAAAFGCFLLAAAADPEQRARSVRIQLGQRSLVLSGYHLLFLCIGVLGLLQIFYLLSRHVSLESVNERLRLSLHLDRVWAGSPGNCTLPGNAPCSLDEAATRTPLQPAFSALGWLGCLGALFWIERGERRVRGLYHLAAWTCVALSFMGKAAPGLVLPLCAFGGWLLLQGRLSELWRVKPLSLGLILACVAAPWFVQETARHGMPFFERLFLHDMYERAFGHVHDTNANIDTSFRYYVWQLGYGLFPWSGAIAAGTLYCIAKSAPPGADARFRAGTQLCVAWQLACFGLFSIAGTKFHHYILPLVPAAAVLAGVWLDELWQRERTLALSALGLGAAALTLLVARDLARPGAMPGAVQLLQLFTYEYSRPWPPEIDFGRPLWTFGLLAALSCLPLGLFFTRRHYIRRAFVAALGTVGVSFSLWAMYVYLVRTAPHWSQRETISTYYKSRSGPEELLVAYRQNWMGENFYTSNHLATFKAAGKPFTDWVAQRRASGPRVLFVTTEHKTIAQLKRELGNHSSFELLTTPSQNNKFVLARVVL